MSKVASILRAHQLARAQKVRRAHTRVETISEDERSAREYAAFQNDFALDELTIIPDRLGKTGEYEPKSIYSPAPPSKFRMERPRKKSVERTEHDCELPADLRRHHTLTVTNGHGKNPVRVVVNPFNRTIHISGSHFRDGASMADKRKAK